MSTGKQVLVVGAGTMGADLAFDLSAHGHSVILKDIHEDALVRAKKRMGELLRLVLLMDRARFGGAKLDAIMSRIRFTTSYEGLEDVHFVIENVVEDLAVKREVYTELGRLCREDTVFGVNTSCVSITTIGSFLPRPDRAIGMHLLNPVPLKRLVEVIVGHHTSAETVDRAKALLDSLGKEAVVVQDSPGFVTNRILMLTINEAAFVVHDRIAEPAQVDRIFTEGFSHKMGPLATGDLIGLDTILKSLIVLYESFKDPKFRPCPLLVRMVDAGLLGRKSGKGFFDYGKVP
ncbi:3-hydroxyacyl-CoA dehydrogenase family protein [Polyangium sp. y55x31]|uniref:3-hydroxyacyl-CoA dehydrogenase family protein n=1 Tax=Polyangium sp. y55x31 TaxID=3042688 RepID=UPI0024828429|nr:3-hydroxyacyl-CoA dehydrogenase family protein [Polyangium sp. y55x31]MDI1475024.1 3-hydroxyacyl-CoA dehydrogenase family protein [Polyangium sp. y55x31]